MNETLASQCKYRLKKMPMLFEPVRQKLQEHISSSLSTVFFTQSESNIDDIESRQIKLNHIKQFVEKEKISFGDWSKEYTVNRLYYSLSFDVLYEPLFLDNNVEKINCNGWEDIFVTFTDGSKCKICGFATKERALDVVRKLMGNTKGIDFSTPVQECELMNNIRVTAMQYPVVSEQKYVTFSIRKLNPYGFTKEEYIKSSFITEESFDFLSDCLSHGVSVTVAGRVGTGKTMFLAALIKDSIIKYNKRVFAIETGAREINVDIVTRNGEVESDVVYALARKSDNSLQTNVSQEYLVSKALRYDSEIIIVSEMRDEEAYAAQEAGMTGSTVITSLHASGPQAAHERISDLARKKHHVDYQTGLIKACKAFPVVVFLMQGRDYKRRCMSITEVVVNGDACVYTKLFGFEVEQNLIDEFGNTVIIGEHHRYSSPSSKLLDTIVDYGATREIVKGMEKDGEKQCC